MRLTVLSTLLSATTARTLKPEAPTEAIRDAILQKATLLTPEQSRQLNTQRRLSDDDDTASYTDYYAKSETFSNAFGFNPTYFSLSYSRCAQVRQFDDDVAARADTKSVFTTKHFAIFRLCPSKTCDPYAITRDEVEEDAQQQQQYNANGQQVEEEQYMGMDFQTYQAYRQDKYKQYKYVNAQSAQAAADVFAEESAQFSVGGASGSGCSSNYGEYMIELEDYLDIVKEDMNGRFNEYCKYCEKCMYNEYNNEYKNWAQHQGRDLFEQSDEGWRHLEFERQLGGCAEYDMCRYYANACNNGLENDVTEFFQCKASGDYYVGPHCADDGVTITLGAYQDENCDEYAGGVYNLTGQKVDQEAVDIWSTGNLLPLMPEGYQEEYYNLYGGWEDMCIPCSEAGASIWNQVDDESAINNLCLGLYETSLRCDHRYNNYQSKSKSIGLYDQERMTISCNYIDRASMGTYDESGLLSLSESPLIKYHVLEGTEYYDAAAPYMAKVSGWQIVGLIASLVACIALAAYSIRLHRSLTKKGQWRPVRKNRRTAPFSPHSVSSPHSLARPDSGIGMARNASGTSFYMA